MSKGRRELLGRLVRKVWVDWAKEQPNPKPSWLVPWEEMTEPDREVDCRIGEALVKAAEDAMPFEVQAVIRLYKDAVWEGWQCKQCGCEYPRSIITACPSCSEAAKRILEAPRDS